MSRSLFAGLTIIGFLSTSIIPGIAQHSVGTGSGPFQLVFDYPSAAASVPAQLYVRILKMHRKTSARVWHCGQTWGGSFPADIPADFLPLFTSTKCKYVQPLRLGKYSM